MRPSGCRPIPYFPAAGAAAAVAAISCRCFKTRIPKGALPPKPDRESKANADAWRPATNKMYSKESWENLSIPERDGSPDSQRGPGVVLPLHGPAHTAGEPYDPLNWGAKPSFLPHPDKAQAPSYIACHPKNVHVPVSAGWPMTLLEMARSIATHADATPEQRRQADRLAARFEGDSSGWWVTMDRESSGFRAAHKTCRYGIQDMLPARLIPGGYKLGAQFRKRFVRSAMQLWVDRMAFDHPGHKAWFQHLLSSTSDFNFSQESGEGDRTVYRWHTLPTAGVLYSAAQLHSVITTPDNKMHLHFHVGIWSQAFFQKVATIPLDGVVHFPGKALEGVLRAEREQQNLAAKESRRQLSSEVQWLTDTRHKLGLESNPALHLRLFSSLRRPHINAAAAATAAAGGGPSVPPAPHPPPATADLLARLDHTYRGLAVLHGEAQREFESAFFECQEAKGFARHDLYARIRAAERTGRLAVIRFLLVTLATAINYNKACLIYVENPTPGNRKKCADLEAHGTFFAAMVLDMRIKLALKSDLKTAGAIFEGKNDQAALHALQAARLWKTGDGIEELIQRDDDEILVKTWLAKDLNTRTRLVSSRIDQAYVHAHVENCFEILAAGQHPRPVWLTEFKAAWKALSKLFPRHKKIQNEIHERTARMALRMSNVGSLGAAKRRYTAQLDASVAVLAEALRHYLVSFENAYQQVTPGGWDRIERKVNTGLRNYSRFFPEQHFIAMARTRSPEAARHALDSYAEQHYATRTNLRNDSDLMAQLVSGPTFESMKEKAKEYLRKNSSSLQAARQQKPLDAVWNMDADPYSVTSRIQTVVISLFGRELGKKLANPQDVAKVADMQWDLDWKQIPVREEEKPENAMPEFGSVVVNKEPGQTPESQDGGVRAQAPKARAKKSVKQVPTAQDGMPKRTPIAQGEKVVRRIPTARDGVRGRTHKAQDEGVVGRQIPAYRSSWAPPGWIGPPRSTRK